MTIRMKLRGLGDIKARIRSMPKEVHTEVDKGMAQGANIIALDAVKSIMTGKKTGRMYGDHQASAPGEPPANRTGELAGSITTRRKGLCDYQIVATAPHAAFLEEGTSKMDPRPFLVPALNRGRQIVLFLIKQGIERGLRKVSRGKKGKPKR